MKSKDEAEFAEWKRTRKAQGIRFRGTTRAAFEAEKGGKGPATPETGERT